MRLFCEYEPLFVTHRHMPVISKSKTYKYGDLWPWRETGVPIESVKVMFDTFRVNHVPEWEEKEGIASPAQLTYTNLEKLITLVNGKVKDATTSTQQYSQKKIKHSKVRDRQIGLIKTWRVNNVRWEELINFYDKTLLELYLSQGKEPTTTVEETPEEVKED